MSNQNTNQSNLERTVTNNATTARILLDFYITLHNQTVRRIDSLYEILDETREAINILGGINIQGENRPRQYIPHLNTNPYYMSGENSNIRGNYRGGRGRQNNNNRTTGGRNNMSTNRSQNYSSTNFQPNTFDARYNNNNNRIYIEGRPYRIEFDRYTIPTNRDRYGGTEHDLLNFVQQFYSNVPVVANPQQVRRATRVTRFSEITNPINTTCPITLEPFTDESSVTQILRCTHIFNPEAFNSWFETNVRCPICRYDIRTNIPISTRQEETKEETKEETELQETKEDEPIFVPNVSSREIPIERNSNLRNTPRIHTYPTETDISSSNNLESAFTDITGALLNQILNPTQRETTNRLFFNNSFDSSNNEIIFRGFRM